ncbi:major facilitator superfamily transporter [Ceratobasidium sp. AG-Ba]|nr:major facilitator superfamily transporter [Ceratobasidium sp. AG-Ba]
MTGPFIAARSIFSSGHEDNVTNTEWICLARSMFGVAVAAIFLVCDLPETPESDIEDIEAEAEACLAGPRKREVVLSFEYRLWFGWLCQFLYVGTQVASFSFFISYGVQVVGWSNTESSTFFSYALLFFLAGRISTIGVVVLCPVELMLGLWGAGSATLVCCAILFRGTPGLICLMMLFFFQGPLIPCGAIFPTLQGTIAESYGVHVSYAVCLPAYIYMVAFGVFLWYYDGCRPAMPKQGGALVPETLLSRHMDKKASLSSGNLPAEGRALSKTELPPY